MLLSGRVTTGRRVSMVWRSAGPRPQQAYQGEGRSLRAHLRQVPQRARLCRAGEGAQTPLQRHRLLVKRSWQGPKLRCAADASLIAVPQAGARPKLYAAASRKQRSAEGATE